MFLPLSACMGEKIADENPTASTTPQIESTIAAGDSGYVKADNAELYYRSYGAGPTVIFIHGSAGNSDLWEQQVPDFVNAGYRVVTFDLRSAGRSRPRDGFSTSGSIANDVEAIRKALNLDEIVVIGQALGGEGALEYALRYPERAAGIVVAASYRGAEAERDFVELRNRLAPPSLFKDRSGTEMRLSAHYIETNPQGVARFEAIDASNKGRQAVNGKLDTKRLVASVQSSKIALNYEALSQITAPTLVLSAERDDITPPALMSELAKQIPSATYMTVSDAGRYAFWENPAAFNEVVLDFLNTVKWN